MLSRRPFILLLLLVIWVVSTSTALGAIPSLTSLPVGERWFSILMNGDRVGFSRLTIAKTGDGYQLQIEGSVRMTVLGFTRDASSRESYAVNPDLTLQRFQAELSVDGSAMRLAGEVAPKVVKVTIYAGGARKVKNLKYKGRLYPAPLLNIYPLIKGGDGKECRVQFFDAESITVKETTVTVVGVEKGADGRDLVHLKNDLYPFVENDIWIDQAGNTVRESVRDGLVVTEAEDEAVVKRFLAEAMLARKDLVFDFSLIRVTPPISKPAALKRLDLELTGMPETFPLLQGGGQQSRRVESGKALFSLERPVVASSTPLDEAEIKRYLEPNERIPVDAPEIGAKAQEIVGQVRDPMQKVDLLARWVATNVAGGVTDTLSPLDTLRKGEGNCQSHARLYVSLARAAGIPSKFVSGLVYAEGVGFLYHSWAESYVGGWQPVDPTFGQHPADATHVKLLEGDGPDDLAPLAGLVGRLKVKVLETKQ